MSDRRNRRTAGLVAALTLIVGAAAPSIAGTDDAVARILARTHEPVEEMEAVSAPALEPATVVFVSSAGDGALRARLAALELAGLLGSDYTPQKNLRKDCVGSLGDCALMSFKYCEKKGSPVGQLAYIIPGTDVKYPEGGCVVHCINGDQAKAKMCGEDQGTDPGCPCQSDPCQWGSDACCAGQPPEWCGD